MKKIDRKQLRKLLESTLQEAHPGEVMNFDGAVDKLIEEVSKGIPRQFGGFPANLSAIIDACQSAGLIDAAQSKAVYAAYRTN